MSEAGKLEAARAMAATEGGVSNGEFAKALGLSSQAAGAYLSTYVKAGHIFRGAAEGHHGRFFDTKERAAAYRAAKEQPAAPASDPPQPLQLARRAVGYIKKGTIGSAELAKLCQTTAPAVDAVLDPLVVPGRLIRVSVLRRGAPEFDYRLSAAWAPQEADFAVCAAVGTPPTPSISPVAPPSPKAISAPPSVRPQATIAERSQASRNGGASSAANRTLEQSLSTAASLGWAPAARAENQPTAAPVAPAASQPAAPPQAPAPVVAAPTHDTPPAQPVASRLVRAVNALATQTGEDAGRILDWLCDDGLAQMALAFTGASQEVPGTGVLRVDDLVCAMNSRGELALDLDQARQVVFPPAQALYLMRFLVNTTILEALDATGCV